MRDHITFLTEAGVGLKQVAKVTGLSHGALSKLVYGTPTRPPSRRVRPATAERILAVTPAAVAGGGKVPAAPVWEKVNDLVAAGVPKAELARRLGQTTGALQLGREFVSGRHARTIAAIHRQWRTGGLDIVRRSRHGDRTVHIAAPPGEDLAEQVRRANETAGRATRRQGEWRTAVVDDADRFLLNLADTLETRIDNAGWRRRASCRDQPAWLFFPAKGDGQTAAAAKAVCDRCPVRSECLAAHVDEPWGIWGGTSTKQRRALRRAARTAA